MSRIGDILANVILDGKGDQAFTYTKTTSFTDEDVNNVTIIKVGSEFFKMNNFGALNIILFGAVADGVTDNTEAINKTISAASISGFKEVVIPDSGNSFFAVDGNINLQSNVRLIFQKGAIIKRLPAPDWSYEILSLNGVSNVEIIDPVIIGDVDEHIGTTGESGMGIYIVNSKNVTVSRPIISKCGGDGIYIGAIGSDKSLWNDNINIVGKPIITDCRRQAISIICGYNVFIDHLFAKDIIGTAPSAAIDFEPNNGDQDITCRVGTIESDNTDAAFLFVHMGGYYDISIDKVIEKNSRSQNDDGGHLFLGNATEVKDCGSIHIGEIIRDSVINHPLFLVKDWYTQSSPKITIGKYSLDLWDNSAITQDNKHSVMFQFLSTTNTDFTASGNFKLLDLQISNIVFQNGKILRPYYITGPANTSQVTLSNVLIEYGKLPLNAPLGDGQSVFKVADTVEIRQNLSLAQTIEKKSASFTPINGKQYNITTSVALDLVLSGFNSCVLYGLAASPSTIYLVSNASNSLLTTFIHDDGVIDTSSGTPAFLLNFGDKVLLQRKNVSELHVSILEKQKDYSADFIANSGVEKAGAFNITGIGSVKAIELRQNAYTNWKAAEAFPSLYSTSGAGSTAPFTEAGHAIMNLRSAGAIRDFIIYNGAAGIFRFFGNDGSFEAPYGKITAGIFKVNELNAAPASATDTGSQGEIRVTAGFIYVCIATNTWVRTALTTW